MPKEKPEALVNQNAGDDIPFPSQNGDGPGNAAPANEGLREIVRKLNDELDEAIKERDDLKKELEEAEAAAASANEQARKLVEGQGSIGRREIFLAIVQGMASNGDFTVGSKLNNDDSIRNAARHAAGVSSFFFQAARDARV